MFEIILTSLFFLPVLAFILLGIGSKKENRLGLLLKASKIIPIVAVILSIIGFFWLFNNGTLESGLIGFNEIGISIRLDALSLIMFLMVSIIAFVVLKFSHNYLEGDPNQGKFIGGLALTIGFVQLLVLSGNIFLLFFAWVATSLALNRLIRFYPERKKARVAASKKFKVARLGDLSLLIALSLIYIHVGSGNLTTIFQAFQGSEGVISYQLELAALFLVLTAALKSAQIPFHGWLIEVMEAPTPVSALLHAGLLNAGPFLMIRFAYILDAVSIAPVFLFVIGALTALYGAIVFTTQPNIKTALAYSSVGHMGFTLMVSGLGLYSASLLHLVAHSFYKAHSFLSSGSVIEKVRTNEASSFKRKGSVKRIAIGFVLSIVLFKGIAMIWNVDFNSEFQLLIIAGVIFIGAMSLLVNALDSGNYYRSILKILAATALMLTSFFALEELMRHILGNQIPLVSQPSPTIVFLAVSMLAIFFLIVLSHLFSPLIKKGGFYKKLGIHVRNGLYLNQAIERVSRPSNSKA